MGLAPLGQHAVTDTAPPPPGCPRTQNLCPLGWSDWNIGVPLPFLLVLLTPKEITQPASCPRAPLQLPVRLLKVLSEFLLCDTRSPELPGLQKQAGAPAQGGTSSSAPLWGPLGPVSGWEALPGLARGRG